MGEAKMLMISSAWDPEQVRSQNPTAVFFDEGFEAGVGKSHSSRGVPAGGVSLLRCELAALCGVGRFGEYDPGERRGGEHDGGDALIVRGVGVAVLLVGGHQPPACMAATG